MWAAPPPPLQSLPCFRRARTSLASCAACDATRWPCTRAAWIRCATHGSVHLNVFWPLVVYVESVHARKASHGENRRSRRYFVVAAEDLTSPIHVVMYVINYQSGSQVLESFIPLVSAWKQTSKWHLLSMSSAGHRSTMCPKLVWVLTFGGFARNKVRRLLWWVFSS